MFDTTRRGHPIVVEEVEIEQQQQQKLQYYYNNNENNYQLPIIYKPAHPKKY